MAVQYLSLAEVLVLHEQTIAATGGSQGVRDETLVESAIARPRASYGDYEAYPGIYSKAAVLLEGLIKNHGFVDGNKRIATVTVIIFLKRNGHKLITNQEVIVEFAVAVAEGRHSVEEIAAWLKQHSSKI